MRVLVTGSQGFVGQHLHTELAGAGHEVLHLNEPEVGPTGASFWQGDIRDAAAVEEIIRESRPEAVIHLAGIAFVPTAWSRPNFVIEVNLCGTINLLEALRTQAPKARLLAVTSSEVYGREGRQDGPVTEDRPLRPNSLYGVTKASADQSVRLYAQRYGMHAMTARPENHIGPGQSDRFVSSSFATQLASKKQRGDHSPMRVGNLESERDFTDVRDVVRAYRLLIESGQTGQAYNIASGKQVKIRVLLEHLMDVAGLQLETEKNEELWRPADQSPEFSIEKIKQSVGWEPEIPLRKTLQDLYHSIHRDHRA